MKTQEELFTFFGHEPMPWLQEGDNSRDILDILGRRHFLNFKFRNWLRPYSLLRAVNVDIILHTMFPNTRIL